MSGTGLLIIWKKLFLRKIWTYPQTHTKDFMVVILKNSAKSVYVWIFVEIVFNMRLNFKVKQRKIARSANKSAEKQLTEDRSKEEVWGKPLERSVPESARKLDLDNGIIEFGNMENFPFISARIEFARKNSPHPLQTSQPLSNSTPLFNASSPPKQVEHPSLSAIPEHQWLTSPLESYLSDPPPPCHVVTQPTVTGNVTFETPEHHDALLRGWPSKHAGVSTAINNKASSCALNSDGQKSFPSLKFNTLPGAGPTKQPIQARSQIVPPQRVSFLPAERVEVPKEETRKDSGSEGAASVASSQHLGNHRISPSVVQTANNALVTVTSNRCETQPCVKISQSGNSRSTSSSPVAAALEEYCGELQDKVDCFLRDISEQKESFSVPHSSDQLRHDGEFFCDIFYSNGLLQSFTRCHFPLNGPLRFRCRWLMFVCHRFVAYEWGKQCTNTFFDLIIIL